MNFFLSILAIVLIIVGFFGTFIPVIPGVPLAWLGLLAAFFIDTCNLPTWILILCGIIAVVVSVLDNIFPFLFTKKQNASKLGTWGLTIGVLVGFFAGPAGIFFGPFLGALIGEMINDSSDLKRAFKVAFFSFLGFLCGIGVKMITVVMFGWLFLYFSNH